VTCSGESISLTSISVSGTATFNADMTYMLSLSEQAAVRLSLPQSCLQGHTCGDLQTALESTGDFASVPCSTSGACSCDAAQPTNAAIESGTYTLSGSTVTTTSSTGAVSAISYCVQGAELHLLDVDDEPRRHGLGRGRRGHGRHQAVKPGRKRAAAGRVPAWR
jgi:hypothetical protein